MELHSVLETQTRIHNDIHSNVMYYSLINTAVFASGFKLQYFKYELEARESDIRQVVLQQVYELWSITVVHVTSLETILIAVLYT